MTVTLLVTGTPGTQEGNTPTPTLSREAGAAPSSLWPLLMAPLAPCGTGGALEKGFYSFIQE